MLRKSLLIAAAGALLLWPLRDAMLVNCASIELMHAAMARLQPRRITSRDMPARLDDARVADAAGLVAGIDSRPALRVKARAALWSGDARGAAAYGDALSSRGISNFDSMFAASLHMAAGDRQRAVAEWIRASRAAGMLDPLAVALSEQVPNDTGAEARACVRDAVAALRAAELDASEYRRRYLTGRIAFAYEQTDDVRGAEEALRPNAVAGDAAAQAEMAMLAMREGRVDEAEHLARSVAVSAAGRGMWLPHYVMATAALQHCDVDAAVRELRRGLAMHYDGDFRYFEQMRLLAVAEYERGNDAAAAERLRQYAAAQPSDPASERQLAQIGRGTLPRKCAGGARS